MAENLLFRLLGPVSDVQVIARGRGIRILQQLQDRWGGRNWRKMKGIASIEDENGWIGKAEVHWYEAHGVGRVSWKIKRRFAR